MNIDSIERVGVAGFAKSGLYLAYLLLKLKKKVFITESKEAAAFPSVVIEKLRALGVSFEFGGHSENFLKNTQLVIFSPGIDALTSPAGALCRKLNIMQVGEIEFCYWLTKAKCVAITGTNGKTTTTFLTYRVLKENQGNVYLGGNIGIPFSSFVLKTKPRDIIVLELSSFQLETIIEFKPFVAAITNIEPDHMDRYPKFQDYFEAKMNIFKNQTEDDFAVLNGKSEFLIDIKRRTRAKVVTFADEFENENLSCVYRIAAGAFGLSKLDCQKVFNKFTGLPHRLQLVRKVNGVNFINDSKATNPASTVWALKNLQGPIILIAGGKDKGLDYNQIIPYMKNVKKINLFGAAAKKIDSALSKVAPTQFFNSLEDVIRGSLAEAKIGDSVVLSPMCASYDMFKSYIDRGRQFKDIVNSL